MIGQERLISDLKSLIHSNQFPRFCILAGDRGSGKKLIADYIGKELNYITINTGISVADIKGMIESCHTITEGSLRIIPDADGMSLQAKNALLKITEEPPNNTYIIMTLEDINNTLDTIRSRATVFQLEPYSSIQLEEYAKAKGYSDLDIIKDICENPGQVDLLCSYDVQGFYGFVIKTVEHIATANGANIFKLSASLKLKDDGDGYDLKLFLKMFIKVCKEKYEETNDDKYLSGVIITSNYLKDLRISGISKVGVIDLWILDIRKEWM